MYPTFQKHCTQKYSQSIVRSESICWKIYGREKLSFIKRGKKIKGVFWQWMAVCLQLLHFLRREKKFYTADSSLFLFPIWWRTNTLIHFRNRRGVWVLGFGIIWVTGLILADVFQRQPLTNQSESIANSRIWLVVLSIDRDHARVAHETEVTKSAWNCGGFYCYPLWTETFSYPKPPVSLNR